jgi:uncharacterized protein (DUF305 family)
MKPLLFISSFIIILLLITLTIGMNGCGARTQDKALPMGKANSGNEVYVSEEMASAPYNEQFIDTMIVHHQAAIDASKLALLKAGHKELKDLAQSIITSQTNEINLMKAWHDKWYPNTKSYPNMNMKGMKETMNGMQLNVLREKTGLDFDLTWLNMMIPHHQGAIIMAQDAQQNSDDQDVKDLAEQIISAQQKEITLMQSWESLWSHGE